jgi:hypothetical protein
MVLKVLREKKLYAKLSKSIFYQKKIHHLRHIISTDRITVGLENKEANRGWPTPRNFIEVISFMGLAGYYRIFIKGFSNIVSPITSLQKKGVKFEWNSKCEERFQQLKDIMTSAPILNIAYLDGYFFVCKEGIGGFFTQKDHVLFYES